MPEPKRRCPTCDQSVPIKAGRWAPHEAWFAGESLGGMARCPRSGKPVKDV